MPITLLRIDERLIHGQVVVGWGERFHVERILVVDDELRASSWEQELYRLGVPPNVESVFLSVAEAADALPDSRTDPQRAFVLVRDVHTLSQLAEDGLLEGLEVNLGGIHSAPGRHKVLPYLYLSEGEMLDLREIAASGIVITARDVPASRPIPLAELTDHN